MKQANDKREMNEKKKIKYILLKNFQINLIYYLNSHQFIKILNKKV